MQAILSYIVYIKEPPTLLLYRIILTMNGQSCVLLLRCLVVCPDEIISLSQHVELFTQQQQQQPISSPEGGREIEKEKEQPNINLGSQPASQPVSSMLQKYVRNCSSLCTYAETLWLAS